MHRNTVSIYFTGGLTSNAGSQHSQRWKRSTPPRSQDHDGSRHGHPKMSEKLEDIEIICVIGEITSRLLTLLDQPRDHDRLTAMLIKAIIIGGPGVGKGTQCKKLAKDFNAVHVSIGDLLRAQKDKLKAVHNTDLDELMVKSQMVDKDLAQEYLEECLLGHVNRGKRRFLVDGFPRIPDQARYCEGRVSGSLLSHKTRGTSRQDC